MQRQRVPCSLSKIDWGWAGWWVVGRGEGGEGCVSSKFPQRAELRRVISVEAQGPPSYPLTILLANFACPSDPKFLHVRSLVMNTWTSDRLEAVVASSPDHRRPFLESLWSLFMAELWNFDWKSRSKAELFLLISLSFSKRACLLLKSNGFLVRATASL